MIVLVSNGRSHSDHRLYFVEAPSIAAVKAVMNPMEEWMTPPEPMNPDAKVVGTCNHLVWAPASNPEWPDFETMTLEAFAEHAKRYL